MSKKEILNYLADDFTNTIDYLQKRLPNVSETKLLAAWIVKHLAALYELQNVEQVDEETN